MGCRRNSSYAGYTAGFIGGRLIAIDIDIQRLPSTRFKRFDEGAGTVDVVLRNSVIRLWRQAPHSRPVSATDNKRTSDKFEARATWAVGHARKSARRAAVRREMKAFRSRLEAAKARKQRRRGAIEVQSFEIKTVLWKIKPNRTIAVELPRRLLTFAKHLSTCGVAQGAI
jgi:hypothetical protein